MTPRFAIIDTSVLVSGLVTATPQAPTARIVDAMLGGRFPFLLSVELIAEYRSVLLRPKLRQLHRLEESEVDELLTVIGLGGVLRELPPVGDLARRQKDAHLWALLDSEPGTVLVTGDRALFSRPAPKASVLSPRAFLDLLAL